MPKAKPTGNRKLDQDAITQRFHFQKLCHWMENHPEDILPTFGDLEAKQYSAPAQQVKTHWDDSVYQIRRIPKTWKGAWMCANDTTDAGGGKLKFTKDLLDKMDAKDPNVAHKIFNSVLLFEDTTKMCASMHDKMVAADVFAHRLLQTGNYLQDWCSKFVLPNHTVDWSPGRACPYGFIWDSKGVLASVTFREQAQVDVSIMITREFDMEYPWDVFKARFVKEGTPPQEHLCHQFWPAGAGPNVCPLDKKGKTMLAIAEEKAKEKAKGGASASVSADVLEDTDDFIGKERKKVVSDRLKVMQKDAKVSAKRQRTVALGKRSPAEVPAAPVPGASSGSAGPASVAATPAVTVAVPAVEEPLFGEDGDEAPVGKATGKGKGRKVQPK